MEKIVIFVIIIIVSQIFKNRKKRSTFSTKNTDTTFFDSKGNTVSESGYKSSSKPIINSSTQPQSISDALSELKNIFNNTPQHEPKLKSTPMEPVYETNYNEVSTEANNADYSENNYQQVQSNYETLLKKNETDRINKMKAVSNPIEEKINSYTVKTKKKTYRKDILSNLFNTKNELKKAVILTEVFNKKY